MTAVKRNALVCMVCVAMVSGVWGVAYSEVSSTNPAGLVVFPKLLLDSDAGTDTEVQLSNTSSDPIRVRCYLVNANSHCSNAPAQVCKISDECGGGACLPGWTETDFRLTLTRNQPIVWRLSEGLQVFPLDGLNRITHDGQFNSDSNIPRAPEDPFLGELKCFEVDDSDSPTVRNDLKGEATIVTVALVEDVDWLDARKYNAVGLKSTGANDGDDTLCLGGGGTDECPAAEYEGCPNVLVLDHFFDYAPDPSGDDPVITHLTMVPCSQDFLTQRTFATTVQFLVFNEFEQRMSTSRRIQCLEEIQLSDIDTRWGNDSDNDGTSIFSFQVQGTLTGQSRIRAVQTPETDVGHGILAVAEEFHECTECSFTGSGSFNVHYSGSRDQGDIVRAPRE